MAYKQAVLICYESHDKSDPLMERFLPKFTDYRRLRQWLAERIPDRKVDVYDTTDRREILEVYRSGFLERALQLHDLRVGDVVVACIDHWPESTFRLGGAIRTALEDGIAVIPALLARHVSTIPPLGSEKAFSAHLPLTLDWLKYAPHLKQSVYIDEEKFESAIDALVEAIQRECGGANPTPPELFDVFLCHNSHDKSFVREIAERLTQRSVRSWLDEQQIRPGVPWQDALEQQIQNIQSAAVFVGLRDITPWQDRELKAFLNEFVERNCPVIPVILPDALKTPNLPVFLKGQHWVDFRAKQPDPFEQLVWGITGKHAIGR